MYKKILLGAVAGAVATIAGAASATTLDFSYSGGSFIFEGFAGWTQSSDPTPLSYDTGADTTVAASGGDLVLIGGFFPIAGGPISSVEFYSTANGGGFSDGSAISDFGLQIYSGTEAAPVFTPGSYQLTFGTLTISDVPEPATWTMMILGVAGIGAALRRRKAQPLEA